VLGPRNNLAAAGSPPGFQLIGAAAPTKIRFIALKGRQIMRRFRDCFLLLTVLYPLWLATPALASCSSPANAIEAENCLPGTPQTTWDVSGAGDSTIQGFTTDISV